jgi:hypothetical protein
MMRPTAPGAGAKIPGQPERKQPWSPAAYRGLAQATWPTAVVSIPHVTYDQLAAVPHICASAMKPGDLLSD